MTRSLINKAQNIGCGCNDESCTFWSAVCTVCDVAGHEPDNIEVAIVAGSLPQWSCEKHVTADMQVRLQGAIKNMPQTVREQNEAARDRKRAPAELHCMDRRRFWAHAAQSDDIDFPGQGGAAATTFLRTAVGIAAAARHARASKPASHILGAYASDVRARPAGGSTQASTGVLGVVGLNKRRPSVFVPPEDTLRHALMSSAANHGSERCCNREAYLYGGGVLETDEVLASSNPFLGVKSRELKRAVWRFKAPSDSSEQTRMKRAVRMFTGEGRISTDASVACSQLSCKKVCSALTECPASVELRIPFLLASLRQSILRLRCGDEDVRRRIL